MPVYQYQGQHYDLPDGLSNEDAIAKIKSHLGKKEESPVSGFGKQVAGLAEAGASVLAPLPSTIVGGLAGLGDVLSGKGITQGAETLKKVQDWNFGAGAYVPYTEKGKQLSQKTGELLNKPAEFAGDIGEEIGGNLGRANAEFATNVLMNFIPIGGGMMIKSAAKGRAKTAPKELSTKLTALEDATKPVVAPKVPEQMELPLEVTAQQIAERRGADVGQPDLFGPQNIPRAELDGAPIADQVAMRRAMERDALLKAEQEQLPFASTPEQIAEMQNRNSPQADMFGMPKDTTPEGMQARQEQKQMTAYERAQQQLAERQAALEFEVRRQAALDNGAAERGRQEAAPTGFNDWQVGRAADEAAQTHDFLSRAQQSEIDATPHGDRPAQYGFTDTGGRVDENGIPIRADLSMEAQNLQDPLQRNLWGDELPRKSEQEAPIGLTQAIDRMPSPPWEGSARDQAFAQLQNGISVPKGQRGAIDLGTSPEPGKDHPLTALKLTPVQVQDARKQSAVKSVLGNAYVDNITTPEQVLAAVSNGAKDVGPIAAARMKSMGSGLNSAVLSSNNPLLKFGRNAIRTAEKAAEAITTKFITSKDGAGPQWNRLSQAEKNEVAEVLYSQDKHQKFYTQDQLKASGYNERQIKLINHIREMEAEKLRIWNEKRAEVGKSPVEAREGHFPGIFKGDYRTLIVDKDNNPIGFIGTLTKWGNKSVQDKMRATYPDAKFLDLGRKDMGNISNRRNVSGIEELIQLLAEHDPKFAEMQDKISAITSDNADKLYGAEYHARHKKGIIGSEGNKPWQDKTANTNEMMKAYFQYFEEGMLSHMNLPVETQLKALMNNPALDGMPNAKAYLSKYVQHMTGRNPGKLAAAIDTLIDTPGRAVGLGPTPVRNAINQTTKRIGQLLMGYGNIAHSAMQMMQVPTMAFPEFRTIAHQFNIPESVSAGAGMEGVRLLGEMSKEKLTGKKSTLSAYDRTVLDYAEHMGLGHFSEFQDVSKQTQGPRGRAFDDAVDLNRTLPEVTTRPYVFFTISKMLEKHPELSLQEKLSAAYNATQEAMIDYSPRERPMVYSDLGKMGQLTGSLSTFTHGAFGQLGRLGKEAVRGNPVPIISAAAIMFALGGVKGIWGYDTADTIVKYLTEQLGNRRSIRELLLDPYTSSEVIKSGALSVATGADLSSRISVNIPAPGSITEAVAGPFATDLGKRVGSIYELAKEQDSLAAKNALITNLPNSIKKIVRDKMMEDEATGANIASTGTQAGLPGNPRTAQDKTLSKWGVTSLPESLLNETQYNDQRRNMAKADERKQIVKDAVRAYRQLPDEAKQKAMEQFKDKYMAAQGDPQQWVNALVEEGITEGKSKQQRLQGIPSDTLGSIYRYNNFERSRNMEKQRNATKP